MIYAIAWSGGKDAMLALDRSVRAGLDVRYALNLYDGTSGRVRFHGVRCELIRDQAKSLRLGMVQVRVGPRDFEAMFLRGLQSLKELGVGGIIFGNIHLADVRAWYEERTTANGFEHREPIWGDSADVLLAELLDRKYVARVVSVNLDIGNPDLLGRDISPALVGELLAGKGDAAGESGEYHTFVSDGPLFTSPVVFRPGPVFEAENHRMLDLLIPPTAPEGAPRSKYSAF
jgi:diphthine-ammonia ligase